MTEAEEMRRQAVDEASRREKLLAAEDERAAEALLLQQREWLERRHAERERAMQMERQKAAAQAEAQQRELLELGRAQRTRGFDNALQAVTQQLLASEKRTRLICRRLPDLRDRAAASKATRREVLRKQLDWERQRTPGRHRRPPKDRASAGPPTRRRRRRRRSAEGCHAQRRSRLIVPAVESDQAHSYGPRFEGLSNPAPAPDAIPNLSAGFTVGVTPGVVSVTRRAAESGPPSREPLSPPKATPPAATPASAAGSLRLSGLGLDPSLVEQLKQEARAGRDEASTGGAKSTGVKAPSTAARTPAEMQRSLARTLEEQPSTELEENACSARGSSPAGAASARGACVGPDAGSSSEGEGGGHTSGVRCATCDLIGDQMAEHDAWVAELKAAAEAVLDRERATRAKIAEIGGGK